LHEVRFLNVLTNTYSIVFLTINCYCTTISGNLAILLVLQIVIAIAILIVNISILLQESEATINITSCNVFIFTDTVVGLTLDGLGTISIDPLTTVFITGLVHLAL